MDRTQRQKECLKRWLEFGGRASVVACTGFGKTRVALNLIDAFITKNPTAQVLVVVPTQVLKDQWIEQIDARGLGLNTRVEIINSVIKLDWTCDLLIVDEVHQCGAETFSQVFQVVQYKFILCLTGTMERLDMRHLLIEKYAPICDRITIEEAEINGWVAPHREYVVMLDVDLTEYKEINKKFNNAFAFFGFDFNLAMRLATDVRARNIWAKNNKHEAKVVTAMAMTFMRTMKARKDFILNHPKKIEVAKKILAARKDRKCLTFSATIKMAEELGDGFVMHSKKSKKKNQETLEAFNACTSGVMHTSKAAETGLDIPGIDTEIILYTNSSKIRKTQVLGRSIRYEEGKVAEIFTLVLKGTQEVTWLANSKTSRVITINEDQLDRVLAGERIETRQREYVENLEFRF